MTIYFRFSKILLIVFLIIIAYSADICLAQNGKASVIDPTKKEAERLWELAIEAKGGHTRLLNVHNMITSTVGTSRFRGKFFNFSIEHLVVFPDKEWIWDDNRPSIFRLSMTMYNWEAKNKYFTIFNDKEYKGLVPIETSENSLYKMPWIVNILLETKWHKPIPEKFSEGKINSQKVDIVQTRLNGERIDFALDKKTHLPVKFIHYTKNSKTDEEQIYYNGYLSDYINVEGIKMPSGRGKGDNTKTSYQFNVEYNEDIFKTPPTFEAGPEAWKQQRVTLGK